MTSKAPIVGLSLLFLLGLAGYFFRNFGDTGDISSGNSADATIAADTSVAEENNTELNAQPVTDEMHADLNQLVSTDDAVREAALKHLAYEFKAIAEPRYQNYGNDLLPYLHRAINNVDDADVYLAIEAIFHMTMVNQTRVNVSSPALDDEGRQELKRGLEKFGHYPVPSSYGPMKAALINVLINSESHKARYWSAMTLANGFEPRQEMEEVFARQLPLEEENKSVQRVIIQGLFAVAGKSGFRLRSTELAIMDSLDSSNIMTQEWAARLMGMHKIKDGMKRLLEIIPAATDVSSLQVMLHAIVSYEGEATAYIAELEAAAENTNDERRKTEILSAVQKIRNASAE